MVELHKYTDKELSIMANRTSMTQYMRTDASGVTILVTPRASSTTSLVSFYFRSRINGKRYRKNLGYYPDMGIERARIEWAKVKELATKGLISTEPVKITRISAIDDRSFGATWKSWREGQNVSLTENTITKYESIWRTHLHFLENIDVKDLTPHFVLNFFAPYIERKELLTVRRLACTISACLDYAVFLQLIPINPLLNITKYLPKAEFGHFASFNDETLEEDMIELFNKFSDASENIQVLLYMYFYTLLRSVELRRMKVSDIEGNIATVKTKTLPEFKVPLSRQAMECIEYMKKQKTQYNNPYVFEGLAEDGIISENTLNKALNERGYKGKLRVHGIRTCGRQWLQKLPYAKESMIEQCLSHVVGSRTQQAYNRGEYVAERAILMQEWSDFVEKCIGQNNAFMFK